MIDNRLLDPSSPLTQSQRDLHFSLLLTGEPSNRLKARDILEKIIRSCAFQRIPIADAFRSISLELSLCLEYECYEEYDFAVGLIKNLWPAEQYCEEKKPIKPA